MSKKIETANAIAIILEAITPLTLGLCSLVAGTYLLLSATTLDDQKFVPLASIASTLFGLGVGGALGAMQPGSPGSRKRNDSDIEVNVTESIEGESEVRSHYLDSQ